MEQKNDSNSLDMIMTLLFLYAVGAFATVFGYVRLMRGERGELSFKTLLISFVGVCTVLAFSFVSGFLRKKGNLHGLAAALALNLTILPFAIYTAPAYALSVAVGQRTGMHFLVGYALYAMMQFALYGCGYLFSALPRCRKQRQIGLAA